MTFERGTYNSTFALEEDDGGIYFAIWDTTGLPDGRYWVETTLTDKWGNTANGLDSYPDIIVQLIDETPPDIGSVRSYVIKEEEEEEEEGGNGNGNNNGDGNGNDNVDDNDNDNDNGNDNGNDNADGDGNGDRDDDGEYSVGQIIHFEVKERYMEENLSGEIVITRADGGKDIATLPLAHMNESAGNYNATLDTSGLDRGAYHVNAVLWDAFDNRDDDGVPGSPDHIFTLVDLKAPGILASTPEDGEKDVSIATNIVVGFSEPIIKNTLFIGVELKDEYSNTIGFEVDWYERNSTAIFIPEHVLSYSHTYILTFTPNILDIAGNPLAGEVEIRFTTERFVPGEVVDSTFTVFPQQIKIDMKRSERQNFSIHLLDPRTRELPLHYSWYLNDEEMSSGPRIASFNFTAGNLSTANTYEIKITVVGNAVSISYYWILTIHEPGGDDDGPEVEDASISNEATLKWAYVLGAIIVMIGLVMIPFYLYFRRSKRRRIVEKDMVVFLDLKDIGDDDISGETPEIYDVDISPDTSDPDDVGAPEERILEKWRAIVQRFDRKSTPPGKPVVEVLPPVRNMMMENGDNFSEHYTLPGTDSLRMIPTDSMVDPFAYGNPLSGRIIDIGSIPATETERGGTKKVKNDETPVENIKDIVEDFLKMSDK